MNDGTEDDILDRALRQVFDDGAVFSYVSLDRLLAC